MLYADENFKNVSHLTQILKEHMQNQPEREVDDGVQLLTGVLGVGEAFQVDNEDLRKRPQIQLLRGKLMLLTRWAVPKEHQRTKFNHSAKIVYHVRCILLTYVLGK